MIHKGDIIGYSGGNPKIQPSGRSNGSHLHLSVYNKDGILVDPEPYILGQVQQGNSSPFLFPVMLIMLFIIFYDSGAERLKKLPHFFSDDFFEQPLPSYG